MVMNEIIGLGNVHNKITNRTEHNVHTQQTTPDNTKSNTNDVIKVTGHNT